MDSAAAGVLNGRVTEAENPSLKSALKMIAGIQKEREGQPELDMAEGIQLVLDKITGFTNKPSYEI